MNEMHLEFRSRLEGEGEEQPRVRVESLFWRRDGPKGARESVNEYLLQAKGKRRKAKQNVSLSVPWRALAQGCATAPAVPLSADSRSPESRTLAKRLHARTKG